MKRLIFVASIFCFLMLCGNTEAKAQSFLSKPTAIKNLADEAKFLSARLPSLKENDLNEYVIAVQKHRIIKNLLRDLKHSETLNEVVNRYLPSGDVHQLQMGVALFVPPAGNKNRLEWLREELLPLVSY